MANFTVHTPSGQAVTVDAPSQAAALDQVLNASGPDVSSLGSFGRGAAGMIPLGEQAYAGIAGLAEHKPYLQERQELAQEVEADKAQNPGARLAGQAAGVAAPIALTAGLAAPETLGGAALQGAGFGALTGAGNAIDTLASGGSKEQAAGDVALGAGVGAAGGAAGKAVGDLAGKAISALVPSSDEISANATAGILGGTPRQIRSLPGKNPVETLNHMGDVIRNAKIGDEPVFRMGDRLSDRLEKFVALQKQAGKTIGDTVEQAGVEPITVEPLTNSLASSIKFPTPDEKAHLDSVIAMVKSYADDEGKLPFQRLQQLKTDIGKEAFTGQGNPVLQNAYHIVNDIQDSELEKASSIINKPAFDQAKQQYQVMSRALPMLKMGVARELNAKAGLTVPGAAIVTGHPLAGTAALMKPRLEQMAKGAVFGAQNAIPAELGNAAAKVPSMAGAIAASKQIPEAKAVTDLHLDHPAMAPWKAVFDKNASAAKDPAELAKSNAITDFTLSQRDPAYAKAKDIAANSPMSEKKNMAQGGLVTPSGFPEPQESDNPPAGAEVPGEQKALNALNTVAGGYGLGQLGAMGASKLAKVADDLGEAGAIFPDALKGTKVVDEAGNPLTVYHGTDAKFDKFDLSNSGKNSRAFPQGDNIGHFFSTDKDFASMYGPVKEAHLALKNPYAMKKADFENALNQMGGEGLKAALIKRGHDGIELLPKSESLGRFTVTSPKNYVVFDANNIHLKPTMASGGLVSNDPDAMGNLPGLQKVANEIASKPVPMEPSQPVRTAAPKDEINQPFNSQFEEQLKAFLMKPKENEDAN